MRKLESELSQIVDKGRLLQSREEHEYELQDEADQRMYEMKRLLQQTQAHAEYYERLAEELEKTVAKLGGTKHFTNIRVSVGLFLTILRFSRFFNCHYLVVFKVSGEYIASFQGFQFDSFKALRFELFRVFREIHVP